MDSVRRSSSPCDTAISSGVASSRGYRTFKTLILPHEETLMLWWRAADTFDHWMAVSHQCAGARQAVSDYAHGDRTYRAVCDFADAEMLAIYRAFNAPVTRSPASVSQGEGVGA